MMFRRFPDFGKELKRPFEVSEHCYDCAGFYDGCEVYPDSRDREQNERQCENYNRLPDVMPGTCGQKFPAARHGKTRPVEREQESAPATPRAQTSRPAPRGKKRAKAGPRLCECGATLPKGKRLCDTYRTQNRRQTKRGYMRGYMAAQRGRMSQPQTCHFPPQERHLRRLLAAIFC